MTRINHDSRLGRAWSMPGVGRIAGCAAMLAMLASCGSLGLGGGSSDDSDAPVHRSAMGGFFHNLAQGGSDLPAAAPAEPGPQTRFPDAVTKQASYDCPILEIAPDGAALRDPPGQLASGSEGLHYQISISHVARECKDAGTNIAMKLGVEGSVILGPSGSAGTFTVPLQFEAKLGDKVVTSRREALSVTVPADRGRAFFDTVVTDFLIPKNDDVDLYVGLSKGGSGALRTPRHRHRRHARR